MYQFFHSSFQPLYFLCWEIGTPYSIYNRFHHILADIIGRIHIVEVIVMPVFHEMIRKTFEHFKQYSYCVGIVALPQKFINRFPIGFKQACDGIAITVYITFTEHSFDFCLGCISFFQMT